MKFDRIMIVTDIDGTFFNEDSQLVPRNLEAVEYFKANGGRFAIATGRVPESMGRLAPIIDTLVNSLCVCCNGAFLYDFQKKERYAEIELNYDKTAELIRFVRREFPTVGIRISSHQGYLVPKLNDYMYRELIGHLDFLKENNLYHLGSIDELPRDGWTRCAFNDAADTLDRLREVIEEEWSRYFSFMKADPTIYEFQDVTATKGTALDRLRKVIGEPKPIIYAIGDYENDLQMLAHCDVPACPANAIDSVKAVSKLRVCHCNDGAIADLIEQIEKTL